MSTTTHYLRARNQPRAIFFAWAWVALCGLVLAWPAAIAVGHEFAANPETDAPLFKSGSLDLLDFLWRGRSAIATEIGHLVVTLPFMIVASVFPLAVLLASIARVSFADRGWRSIGRLLAFELGGLLAQVLAFWGGLALAGMVAYGTNASLGEERSDLAGAAVFAIFIVIIIAVSIARDLASATSVVSAQGTTDSLLDALHTFGGRTFPIVWGWLWRTSLGWIAIVLAGLLASRIGGKSGLSLVLLLCAHQAALAWKVAWRASWLAASLRFSKDAGY